MSLFIANVTKQVYELHYWVEGSRKPYVTIIRPGSQENVYPQGSRTDHERIVEQHRMYGMRSVNEIDRMQEFVGQCFQFDKPIQIDRLMSFFGRNDEIMNRQAQERRKEAAIATDHLLSISAQETGADLQNFEVGVIEVEQKGVEKQIDETVVVENVGRNSRRSRSRQG